MKKNVKLFALFLLHVLTFPGLLLFVTACNGPVKKDLLAKKEHPKLIKTIGNPKYGNVGCGLQDKAGNLWFGTTQNGLYKYDGKSFIQYLVADGLNHNNVLSLLEDKAGNIWIGTEAGLCIYDGKIFTKINIPVPENLPRNSGELYKTQQIYSMLQAKNGKLWFATIDGVYIYDAESLPAGKGNFTFFEINEAPHGFLTANDKAERMLEDKEGNIWFGGRTNEGVYRYDGKKITKFELKELFQNGPRPKGHKWGWPQLQDKNGNIWFSNWGGAYKFDGESFIAFTKKDGLPGDIVARITEDRNGIIWLGGAGLSRYDGKSFTPFITADGMPELGVWEILEDKWGNTWIGTRETGLYLYDGKKFITYSEYKQQQVKGQ